MGELLGSRSVRIGMALFLLQQASGINAIVYFSSSVFAQARRLGAGPCQPARASARRLLSAPVLRLRGSLALRRRQSRNRSRAALGSVLILHARRRVACVERWVLYVYKSPQVCSHSHIGLSFRATS
jgi:hypothetical protein